MYVVTREILQSILQCHQLMTPYGIEA